MFEVWFAADLYLASGPTVKNPAGFTPEKMLKYISAGLPICGLPHNFKELPVPWHPPEFDLDQQMQALFEENALYMDQLSPFEEAAPPILEFGRKLEPNCKKTRTLIGCLRYWNGIHGNYWKQQRQLLLQ